MAGCFSGLTVVHTASLIAEKNIVNGNHQPTVYVCVPDHTDAQREELKQTLDAMDCKSRHNRCGCLRECFYLKKKTLKQKLSKKMTQILYAHSVSLSSYLFEKSTSEKMLILLKMPLLKIFFLKEVSSTDVKLIPQDFQFLDCGDWRLQRLRIILLTPNCSLSAVSNPVERILQENRGMQQFVHTVSTLIINHQKSLGCKPNPYIRISFHNQAYMLQLHTPCIPVNKRETMPFRNAFYFLRHRPAAALNPGPLSLW